MSNGEGECHRKEEMEKSWTSREMIPVIMMMWWYYDMMIKLRWQRQQERQRRWVTHRDKLSRWGMIPGNLHSWLKLCSLVASQLSPPCGRHDDADDADDDSHDDYDVICKRKKSIVVHVTFLLCLNKSYTITCHYPGIFLSLVKHFTEEILLHLQIWYVWLHE